MSSGANSFPEPTQGRAGRNRQATIRPVQQNVLTVWRRLERIPILEQDACFYLLATIFAVVTAIVAVSADYREWGKMAGVAYGVVTVLTLFVAVRARRGHASQKQVSWTRRIGVLLLVVGAVIVPLVAQLTWRAEAHPGAHAQPEVPVIERAGDRLAHHESPYLAHPTNVGISPSSDKRNVDVDSYFPYLPGMVPFGMINALNGPAELTDARVALVGFTFIVGGLALGLSDASLSRRGRAFQFLVVLPTGALPMVTGGDDLPVLAIMLLGMVLAQRRQPVASGMALGLAATLKFTAWPLLLLLPLVVRDENEQRAPLRYSLSALVVMLPILGLGFSSGPSAFIENVIKFPLGLTPIKSPAASPLLGQVLTNLWPDHRRAITVGLLVVGAAVVLWALKKWRPTTPGGVARFTAFAMCVATLLAPATRFGYLIYPTNLIMWGYVLDGMKHKVHLRNAVVNGDYSSSSTSKILSATVASSSTLSPESAGLIDGLAGVTRTPTSQ